MLIIVLFKIKFLNFIFFFNVSVVGFVTVIEPFVKLYVQSPAKIYIHCIWHRDMSIVWICLCGKTLIDHQWIWCFYNRPARMWFNFCFVFYSVFDLHGREFVTKLFLCNLEDWASKGRSTKCTLNNTKHNDEVHNMEITSVFHSISFILSLTFVHWMRHPFVHDYTI